MSNVRFSIETPPVSGEGGVLTIKISDAAKRRDIRRPWAYLLLGQVVAISFAQSIYLSILSVSPIISMQARLLPAQSATTTQSATSPKYAREIVDRPSMFLITCVLTSLATVALTPTFLPTVYFLPNLLVMHALIMLPLIPVVDGILSTNRSPESPIRRTTGLISFQQFYYLLAILIALIRIPTYLLLLPSLSAISPSSLDVSLSSLQSFFAQHSATLFEHPAQSSIGLDVVFTTLSFILWILLVDFPSLGRSQSVPRAEAGSIRPPSKLVPALTPSKPTSPSQDRAKPQLVEKQVGPGWITGGLVLLMLGIVTPVGGIGVSGSLYLGWREGWVDIGKYEKIKDT